MEKQLTSHPFPSFNLIAYFYIGLIISLSACFSLVYHTRQPFYSYESESRSLMLTLCDPMGCSPWNSWGQNTGVGSLSLPQRIFPTQGSNPGLPLCRQVLYQLSHEGSPRILECVAYPFSRISSCPRNWTWVLHSRQILYQLRYQGKITTYS